MAEDVRSLTSYGTATLFEACPGVRALPNEIRPLFCPIELSGIAYPVRAPAGDNLAVHLALAEVSAGSVLVISTEGESRKGFWGEVMTEAALARGVAGLVTDGAVRDSKAIRGFRFPVFSRGIAIPGTTKLQEGSRNCAIELAGFQISPGDFVAGDDDGVVVIPKDLLEKVRKAAELRTRKETEFIGQLRKGALTIDLLGLRK